MSRKLWIILTCAAAVTISSATLALRDDFANARIATAYAAKQSCSCVHISGRPLDVCLAELPAADQVTVAQVGARVHASVLFGAISANADYDENYGCRLAD